jgi:crotonobetainyl-CoA:carnitine CoA-transferase CaiB-like acyl-CoA transferase
MFKTQVSWTNLSVMNDDAWRNLCGAFECAGLIIDPHFAERNNRYANVGLIKKTAQDILEAQPFDH